jgi:nitrogen PTS system EIIA component
LQILSELAQMFSDKLFRERMNAAAGAAELHQLVAQWQPHAAGQHNPAV